MRRFSPCPLVNVSYRPLCATVRNAAIERPFYFIHTFSAFSSPIMYVFRCKALVVSILVCKVCSWVCVYVWACVCVEFTQYFTSFMLALFLVYSHFYVPLSIDNVIVRNKKRAKQIREKWKVMPKVSRIYGTCLQVMHFESHYDISYS